MHNILYEPLNECYMQFLPAGGGVTIGFMFTAFVAISIHQHNTNMQNDVGHGLLCTPDWSCHTNSSHSHGLPHFFWLVSFVLLFLARIGIYIIQKAKLYKRQNYTKGFSKVNNLIFVPDQASKYSLINLHPGGSHSLPFQLLSSCMLPFWEQSHWGTLTFIFGHLSSRSRFLKGIICTSSLGSLPHSVSCSVGIAICCTLLVFPLSPCFLCSLVSTNTKCGWLSD